MIITIISSWKYLVKWGKERLKVWTKPVTGTGSGPRYLTRDRDGKHGEQFSSVAAGTGIKKLKIPYRLAKVNAFIEGVMGSMKRERLDHVLVLYQRQLGRLVTEYVSYYDDARPHQGIRLGRYDEKGFPSQSGKVVSNPILGGLHHDYSRTAYLNWDPRSRLDHNGAVLIALDGMVQVVR